MEQVYQGLESRWSHRVRFATVSALVIMLALVAGLSVDARADNQPSNSTLSALEGLKFSSLAYIDYSNGKTALSNNADSSYNQFALTRGYFTVEKEMMPWLAMRMTLDLHRDETGDYKIRDKYLYAAFMPKDLGNFTHLKAELGLGHIPWLDFQEHVNPYRMQGTMPIERAGVLNSADLGVSLQGYFGKPLKDAKSLTGNSHYAGRYGSWHFGVYNGGGYHAPEVNQNKVPEVRATIRPVPDALPGLQFSYFGVFGKGNKASDPDYMVNMGMVSFEHPIVIITAEYFQTKGNAKGDWVDSTGAVLKTRGISAFANVRVPSTQNRLAFFGRYDHFDPDIDKLIANKAAYNMVMGGVTYDLFKGNMLMLAFETVSYDVNSGGMGKVPSPGKDLGNAWKIQGVYQIKF